MNVLFRVSLAVSVIVGPLQTAVEATETGDKPPINGGRIILQAILAPLAGGVVAIPFAFVCDDNCTHEDDRRAAWRFFTAYSVVVPMVTWLCGNSSEVTSSLGATYLYGLVGSAVGAMTFVPAVSNRSSAGLAILGMAAPVVGAITGTVKTRRYRRGDSPYRSALLEVRPDRTRFRTPSLVVAANPVSGSPIYHTQLLSVKF